VGEPTAVRVAPTPDATAVTAWTVLVPLLVAVPLLAWWIGGRRFWARSAPRIEPDLYREMVRRHALRPGEAAQVEGAITWGRALQDPRLRAAAVDWAQSLQHLATERRLRRPRLRLVGVAVLVVLAVLVAARLAFDVVEEGWSALFPALLWPLLWAIPVGRMINGPRRAVERNGGPPGQRE
jgi:hypothetical protein